MLLGIPWRCEEPAVSSVRIHKLEDRLSGLTRYITPPSAIPFVFPVSNLENWSGNFWNLNLSDVFLLHIHDVLAPHSCSDAEGEESIILKVRALVQEECDLGICESIPTRPVSRAWIVSPIGQDLSPPRAFPILERY